MAATVLSSPNHRYATYELCGRGCATPESWPRSSRRSPGTGSRQAKWGSLAQPTPTPGPTEEEDHHHDAMTRLFDHYGRYGITGNPNVLGWLLRHPTSFAEFVRRSLAPG